MSMAAMPNYEDLAVTTLEALLGEQRGGSASNQEIGDDVAVLLDLSDETLEVPHGSGPKSEFLYRAAWARTFLRHMGAIENTSRGVWSVTDQGRHLAQSEAAVRDSYREIRRQFAKDWRNKTVASATDYNDGSPNASEGPETQMEGVPNGDPEVGEWRGTLLSLLREMPPDGFEHLCRRILLKSGFTRVEVTGRSGDGGIDGIGVLRVNLISFKIVFQCKRYTNSVGSAAIREFRGSVAGRADKGLFLTTGRFTRDATKEAVRDGAEAIDLIDGDALCELLKDLQLGVKTELVEEVTVEPAFFASV